MALFLWGSSTDQGAWTDPGIVVPNSLANNSIIAGTAVTNTTSPDMWAEFSYLTTAGTVTPTAGGHLAVYVLPALHDGTTYPIGTPANTSAATVLPGIHYCVGVITVQTGAAVLVSGRVLVPIPYGTFKFAIVNRLGVALNATTTAACRHRLIVEAVV